MNLGMETEQVEFKKSTAELKEGIVSIAAILNKHGKGSLFFGVMPTGEVCGQEISESTLRQISQAVGNSIEPRIVPTIEPLWMMLDIITCAFRSKVTKRPMLAREPTVFALLTKTW